MHFLHLAYPVLWRLIDGLCVAVGSRRQFGERMNRVAAYVELRLQPIPQIQVRFGVPSSFGKGQAQLAPDVLNRTSVQRWVDPRANPVESRSESGTDRGEEDGVVEGFHELGTGNLIAIIGIFQGVGEDSPTGVDPAQSPGLQPEGVGRPPYGRTPRQLRIRLEHQLRHHHFPGITVEPVPVLRLRTLAIPGNDGHDRGKGAAHVGGGRPETTGELSYDRPAAIQKLPTIRLDPHLQQVAGRERGNGAMHRMVRAPVPREAQKDVAQAEPPIVAGEFRRRRWEVDGLTAAQHRGSAPQGFKERVRSWKRARARVCRARVIAT